MIFTNVSVLPYFSRLFAVIYFKTLPVQKDRISCCRGEGSPLYELVLQILWKNESFSSTKLVNLANTSDKQFVQRHRDLDWFTLQVTLFCISNVLLILHRSRKLSGCVCMSGSYIYRYFEANSEIESRKRNNKKLHARGKSFLSFLATFTQ